MNFAFVLIGCSTSGCRNGPRVKLQSRRGFLRVAVPALAAPVFGGALSAIPVACQAAEKHVTKTEEEWRKELSPDAFYVLRRSGTERSFTSPLNKEYGVGTYTCAGCETPLFTSDTKFDSGTGWPSFYDCLDSVKRKPALMDMLFMGTEVRCKGCDGHLGHVFGDGPRPTGKRYCINGVALKFSPK